MSTEKLNEMPEFKEIGKDVIENSNEVTPVERPAGLEHHEKPNESDIEYRESVCMCATCILCPMK